MPQTDLPIDELRVIPATPDRTGRPRHLLDDDAGRDAGRSRSTRPSSPSRPACRSSRPTDVSFRRVRRVDGARLAPAPGRADGAARRRHRVPRLRPRPRTGAPAAPVRRRRIRPPDHGHPRAGLLLAPSGDPGPRAGGAPVHPGFRPAASSTRRPTTTGGCSPTPSARSRRCVRTPRRPDPRGRHRGSQGGGIAIAGGRAGPGLAGVVPTCRSCAHFPRAASSTRPPYKEIALPARPTATPSSRSSARCPTSTGRLARRATAPHCSRSPHGRDLPALHGLRGLQPLAPVQAPPRLPVQRARGRRRVSTTSSRCAGSPIGSPVWLDGEADPDAHRALHHLLQRRHVPGGRSRDRPTPPAPRPRRRVPGREYLLRADALQLGIPGCLHPARPAVRRGVR